jgi:hypothetical protein
MPLMVEQRYKRRIGQQIEQYAFKNGHVCPDGFHPSKKRLLPCAFEAQDFSRLRLRR